MEGQLEGIWNELERLSQRIADADREFDVRIRELQYRVDSLRSLEERLGRLEDEVRRLRYR